MASTPSPSALPPHAGDGARRAGSPPPASTTAKRSWNPDAPSYVPAAQTPTQFRASGYQNRVNYQGYPSRQGPGNRDRGGFFRGGGRGRGGRNMPGMRNWNGRGYPGGEYNYSYHQAPLAHGPQYYGRAPRNVPHTAYASPDARQYYSDAVYLAGGLSPAANPEQENMPYSYLEPYPDPTLYEGQDGASFPLIGDNDPDMHSVADSAAAGTEYTQANSSLSCLDSLVTQSSAGSGFRGGRGLQRNAKQSGAAHSGFNSSNPPPANMNSEARRMEQRQKQIDYGKNTSGYQRYISIVPKNRRKRSDPETPKRETRCSKRCWDGLIRQWRRELHVWDPPATKEGEMPEWELPSMTEARSTSQLNPLQETLQQQAPPSGFEDSSQIRASPAPALMPARNLFEDTSSPTHQDFYPSWSEFSLAELDQKFASKIRPNETFEGFGLSPPKRNPDYSWGHCSIDQLDEKFGHKLRISEAVDFSWGPLPTNSSSSPFTPPARSKLFPSPFSYGEATPTEAQLSSISPISKFKPRPQPVGSRPSPNGSSYGPPESTLTPRDRTPGSNRPSMSEPRRLMPTLPDHSGSPLSLYSDDDDSVMIIVGSSASSIPSLASSGQSRTLSRTTTPPRTSTPGSVQSGNILTTPQTSIWANVSPSARSSPGRDSATPEKGRNGVMLLDGVW